MGRNPKPGEGGTRLINPSSFTTSSMERHSANGLVGNSGKTNADFIDFMMRCSMIGQSADINDIDSMMNCAKEYLALCRESEMKITNTTLYAACGLNKKEVHDWSSGKRRANDPRYQKFALFLRGLASQYREILMAEGKMDKIVGIFWQKVYDGYREDAPEEEVGGVDDDNQLTVDQIADKYADTLPE